MAELAAGLSAVVTHEVGPEDTAIAVGSGDLPVLGTPRLIALAEAATVAAVAGALPAGDTSVGTRVVLDHQRASGIGVSVTVTARLVDVSGSRLVFDVRAEQAEAGGPRQVAVGRVERAVVTRDTFLTRVPRP